MGNVDCVIYYSMNIQLAYSETWKTPQPDQFCEICSFSEPHKPMWHNFSSKQTRSVHNLVQWSHRLMSKTRKPLKTGPWHGLPTINGKSWNTICSSSWDRCTSWIPGRRSVNKTVHNCYITVSSSEIAC